MAVDTLLLTQQLKAAELSSVHAASAIGRAVVEGAATKADVVQARFE